MATCVGCGSTEADSDGLGETATAGGRDGGSVNVAEAAGGVGRRSASGAGGTIDAGSVPAMGGTSVGGTTGGTGGGNRGGGGSVGIIDASAAPATGATSGGGTTGGTGGGSLDGGGRVGVAGAGGVSFDAGGQIVTAGIGGVIEAGEPPTTDDAGAPDADASVSCPPFPSGGGPVYYIPVSGTRCSGSDACLDFSDCSACPSCTYDCCCQTSCSDVSGTADVYVSWISDPGGPFLVEVYLPDGSAAAGELVKTASGYKFYDGEAWCAPWTAEYYGSLELDIDCTAGTVTVDATCAGSWPDSCGFSPNYELQFKGSTTF